MLQALTVVRGRLLTTTVLVVAFLVGSCSCGLSTMVLPQSLPCIQVDYVNILPKPIQLRVQTSARIMSSSAILLVLVLMLRSSAVAAPLPQQYHHGISVTVQHPRPRMAAAPPADSDSLDVVLDVHQVADGAAEDGPPVQVCCHIMPHLQRLCVQVPHNALESATGGDQAPLPQRLELRYTYDSVPAGHYTLRVSVEVDGAGDSDSHGLDAAPHTAKVVATVPFSRPLRSSVANLVATHGALWLADQPSLHTLAARLCLQQHQPQEQRPGKQQLAVLFTGDGSERSAPWDAVRQLRHNNVDVHVFPLQSPQR